MSLFLKGAQLFYVWTESPHRTTRDLDLLRYGASAIPELETMFRKICRQPVEESDGIVFVADTVHGEQIREQAEYVGVRIRFVYPLGKIKGTLQVDIGFGDAVTPAPELVQFPVLKGRLLFGLACGCGRQFPRIAQNGRRPGINARVESLAETHGCRRLERRRARFFETLAPIPARL